MTTARARPRRTSPLDHHERTFCPPRITSSDVALGALSSLGSVYDFEPHLAYFRASFGQRASQSLESISHLFDHYLHLSARDRGLISSPSTTNKAVGLAVDALAHCHFGTAHADPVSVQRGLRSYGRAVQSMSASLTGMMEGRDAALQDLPEEDWQHFSFFYLVMAFWEMKMSPASNNWESHIRCLATAIELRGADHAWSKTNFRLLASSRLLLMLHALSARDPQEQPLCVRTAWLGEVHSALGRKDQANVGDLFRSIDYLMGEANTVGSIMTQFDSLLAQISATRVSPNHVAVLSKLLDTAESVLVRNEARLTLWDSAICEISLSTWFSSHSNVVADPTRGHFLPCLSSKAIISDFETVLTFTNLLEYHAITTCWTMIITLHLKLSDMLALLLRIQPKGMLHDAEAKIADHRRHLMDYAIQVLRTVCYATSTENLAAAPFALVTAFQLSIVVLDRECQYLKTSSDATREEIGRCMHLKALAVRYLRRADQNRIPVRIDLDGSGHRTLYLMTKAMPI